MNDSTRALKDFFADFYLSREASIHDRNNYLARSLVCTPFGGRHGSTAGWVICVDGSPPKGILVIKYLEGAGRSVFSLKGKLKKITTEKQLAVIDRFHDEYLNGRDEAFTLAAEVPLNV
jgi:hypothetical protein